MDDDSELKIHAGASVSGEADIRGDVTIHPQTAVHPKAVIVADVRGCLCRVLPVILSDSPPHHLSARTRTCVVAALAARQSNHHRQRQHHRGAVVHHQRVRVPVAALCLPDACPPSRSLPQLQPEAVFRRVAPQQRTGDDWRQQPLASRQPTGVVHAGRRQRGRGELVDRQRLHVRERLRGGRARQSAGGRGPALVHRDFRQQQ
jgi:hypothetical protein